MFPQVNRKQEFTGDEFEQIIFDVQTNAVAAAYLAEERRLESPNQQSHIPEEEKAGVIPGRHMLPEDYSGMSTKIREGLYSLDDFPYYHIKGKVEVIDKNIDWDIYLSRCIFTEVVNLTRLVSTKNISISDCVFLKGLIISKGQLKGLSISKLDGHRIKIDQSIIDSLSLSELTLPIAIEATKVKSLSVSPLVK